MVWVMPMVHIKVRLNTGIFLVSLAALLWGTSFVAVRWGLEQDIDPIIFVTLRFLIAALFFTPIALVKISNLRSLLLQKKIIALGFFNAIGFAFQFFGQQFTSAGKASLFVNFYVLIVPLLAPLFLKEKLSITVIFSAILGFVGAFMVSTNLDFNQLSFTKGTIKGDIITLGAGVSWAIYIILSKRYLESDTKRSGTAVFYGTIVWTSVILSFACPITIIINRSILNSFAQQFSWRPMVAVIYLAIMCTALAFAIYMEGLKRAEAGESSIFMLIEVIVAFILEWIIFGAKPAFWSTIGVALIVFAVIILSLKQKSNLEPNKSRKTSEEIE